jgi:nucleoside-diphosphate-sugar epimerase
MLSKIYGEAMVHQADVPGVIVRPHNVFGPRMGYQHVIPELMMRMRAAPAGSDLEIFSPDHRRTFCYIDDAFELIKRLAADSRAVGQAWNVGNESPEYEIREVAEMVLRTVGADLNLVPGKYTAGSPSRRCPSMKLTKVLTGFEPRVSLQEGIERTYRWYSQYVS